MVKSSRTASSKEPRGRRQTGAVADGGGRFSVPLCVYAHTHALFSSLGKLTAAPFSTAMTLVVLAIAVSLPAALFLLVTNLQQVAGNLESGNRISLFLRQEVSDSAGQEIADRLQRDAKVEEATLITKGEALEEFRKYSGFGEALNVLGDNPLPVVIQVIPKENAATSADIESLLQALQKEPDVDYAQMDLLWVKRLQSMMTIAKRAVALIALLLGIGVIFIIGNTVRLELQNRRDEIMISKLVGATNAFIRRPFLYTGFCYGFAGGVLAWIIVAVLLLLLRGPVQTLADLYQSGYRLNFLGFGESFVLISVSASLGVSGSWLTLLNHLRRVNPE